MLNTQRAPLGIELHTAFCISRKTRHRALTCGITKSGSHHSPGFVPFKIPDSNSLRILSAGSISGAVLLLHQLPFFIIMQALLRNLTSRQVTDAPIFIYRMHTQHAVS